MREMERVRGWVGREGSRLRLCESAAEAHTDSAITFNVFFLLIFFCLPSRLTLAEHATPREAVRKKEVVEEKI